MIAMAISSAVIVIAYSVLNSSTTFMKRNIETLENKTDLESFQRIVTKDIKNCKEIDLQSYTMDNIKYLLKFNKTYGEYNLYKLVRKLNNEETGLLDFILQDGFEITQNKRLYTIKVKYLESGRVKEFQFNVAKGNYSGSTSYESPFNENNDFDYKGYFITIDFSKEPYVNLIKSYNNLNTHTSNQLNFNFYSYVKNSLYDFKIQYNNLDFLYNIGYKFNEEDKFKTGEYSLPKPFELNLSKPKICGIYIKNIDTTKIKRLLLIQVTVILMCNLR